MILLDGKKVAEIETKKLKEKVDSLKVKPSLAIVQVGDLFESNKYISNKLKKANEIGIETKWIKFNNNVSESEIIKYIEKLNDQYDGIIVQLPLPNHLNVQKVLDTIKLENDIDGLSSQNIKNFYNNEKPYFCPATARAILLLLNYYEIDLKQNILVIGESNLVGKPTKKILSQFAKNIESRNRKTGIKGSEEFDILIVAAGQANLINKENVKKGSVIVDVGINTLDNKKIVGDVNFEEVSKKVYAISPVPGGVGPLTVICLLQNLLDKF